MTIRQPTELDLSLIDEDPHQPRTEFNQELLEEMAKTIRSRGVKNPISVHIHPEKEGRYIINDGARRYRASKLAGKKTIKAFVDSDFTKIDQIIVNAHHETFTAREWAILIDQEEKKGKKKTEIAAELGKSRGFITDHAKLLALPDSVAEAFNSGRCTDATALSELAVMWKHDPEEVDAWLEDSRRIVSRGTVKQLRSFLDNRPPPAKDNGNIEAAGNTGEIPKTTISRRARKNRKRKVIVQVMHEGRPARLIFDRPVSDDGIAWFRYEADGVEFESALDKVEFVGFA